MIPGYILVVDDEQVMRDLVGRLLEGLGYALRFATSAEEAVTAVAAEPPVVVVCDVHMGGQSGLWLANQIQESSPTTAIVLATGDDQVPPSDSLARGVVAYVLKPFQLRQLRDAVQEGVRWSQQQSATPSASRRGPIRTDEIK